MKHRLSSETNLRDYLRVLFRYKILILVICATIIPTVVVHQELQTYIYQSQVKMLVSAQKGSEAKYYKQLPIRPGGMISLTLSEIVKSRVVLERVVKALRLYERPLDYEKQVASRLKRYLIDRKTIKTKQRLYEMSPEKRQNALFESAMGRLMGNVSAVPIDQTDIFLIIVRDYNPKASAVIANSVSRSFVIFDLEQQLAELKLQYGEKHAKVRQLMQLIEDLYKTLDGRQLSALDAIGPATVKVIEQASFGEPFNIINKKLGIIVAVLLSLCAGGMLAFVIDFLDQTFKSARDIEKFLVIPFLGSIPKKQSEKIMLADHGDLKNAKYKKSIHNLSNQIYLFTKDKSLKSFLLVDAGNSGESPVIITDVGRMLADVTSEKVVIIDADFRNSSISRILNLGSTDGLSELILKNVALDDIVYNISPNLDLVPAGDITLNAAELLTSNVISSLIKTAEESYDVVLVNCADITNYTDAVLLSTHIDSTILVLKDGKARRQIVQNSIVPFVQKKVNIIGAILSSCKYAIPEIVYKLT